MDTKIAIVILPHFWPNLPPLGLAYLKGFLKEKGVIIDCIDANNLFFNLATEEIKIKWKRACYRDFEGEVFHIIKGLYHEAFQSLINKLLCYDIVGFSCFKSNLVITEAVALLLKRQKPDLKIVLGGPEIASHFFRLKGDLGKEFSRFADCLIVGEGELPLFQYISNPSSEFRILAFQEQEILDYAIKPDFSDFVLNLYPKKNCLPLILSRGCIRHCRFCSERLLYKRFRVYSIKGIVEQIRFFMNKNIGSFIFNDSLINGDITWLECLCDTLIKEFGALKWEAQMAIRPDMPVTLLKKIKKSGCYHLMVGLESGSARTLKNMNKGYTPEDAKVFFKKLKSAGLSFGISLIFGFPGETHEDFMESVNFVLTNRGLIPKIEQVNPFIYYDGIPLSQSYDYKRRPESLERAALFIKMIKAEKIKHTNAYLLNLIDK